MQLGNISKVRLCFSRSVYKLLYYVYIYIMVSWQSSHLLFAHINYISFVMRFPTVSLDIQLYIKATHSYIIVITIANYLIYQKLMLFKQLILIAKNINTQQLLLFYYHILQIVRGGNVLRFSQIDQNRETFPMKQPVQQALAMQDHLPTAKVFQQIKIQFCSWKTFLPQTICSIRYMLKAHPQNIG